jgi:hypothetical protein
MIGKIPKRYAGSPARDGVVVAAADIGSVKSNFGWAIRDENGCFVGDQIDGFASEVVSRINAGKRVALGFEAPLYVPVPENPEEIGKARQGEFVQTRRDGKTRTQSRPFSANGGAASLVLALQQTLYVFRMIARDVSVRPLQVGYRPEELALGQARLLIWEAFLSGDEAKRKAAELHQRCSGTISTAHVADAVLMVRAFAKRYPDIQSDISSSVRLGRTTPPLDREPFSLVGAALLRSRLAKSLTLLAEAPLVIKV